MPSNLEATFALALKSVGCEMQRGYKFHPGRKWEMDFCHPESFVCCEIDGGEFSNGKHCRGVGMAQDYEKRNAAIELGYIVFQLTGSMCKNDPVGWARRVKAVIERRRDGNV